MIHVYTSICFDTETDDNPPFSFEINLGVYVTHCVNLTTTAPLKLQNVLAFSVCLT